MKADPKLNHTNASAADAVGETPPADNVVNSAPQRGPITQSFVGPNIRLHLEVLPGKAPALNRVVIEALDASGNPVAEYRTVGSIHTKLGYDILGECEYIKDASQTAIAARMIYLLLSRSATASWETVPSARAQDSSLSNPSMSPVTPTLQQFTQRPSVVDEQFAAHTITPEGCVRLAALINPEDGLLTITLRETSFESDAERVRTWKVLASNNLFATAQEIREELHSTAHYIAGSLNVGGFDEVVELLDGGSIDALPVVTNTGERALVDWQIGQGDTSTSNDAEVALQSGGSVALQIGFKTATLSVKANAYDDSRAHTITFECGANQGQLTAPQIHYIREIHKLITSVSPSDHDRGITMYLNFKTYLEELNKTAEPSTVRPGYYSLKQVQIRGASPKPDLEGMLGRENAIRVLTLPRTNLRIPTDPSSGVLSNYIDGVRSLIIELSHQQDCPRNPDLFNAMRVGLGNDGRVRVVVVNQMGGGMAGVLEPEDATDSSAAEETIVQLCELFAQQESESWEPLQTYINRLSGAASIDPSERVWDIGFWELPPEEDTSALAMYAEAGNIYSSIATGFREVTPTATASYRGQGAVQLTVARFQELPYFKFKLQDGKLCELTIYKNCFPSSRTPLEGEKLAVFRSDTLEANSPAVQAIAETCSLAYHAYPSVVVGKPATDRIAAINEALIQHIAMCMNRVV